MGMKDDPKKRRYAVSRALQTSDRRALDLLRQQERNEVQWLPWAEPKSHWDSDGPTTQEVRFTLGGAMFHVRRAPEEGLHTGRARFCVVCLTCKDLLHEATTGTSSRIRDHLERVHNYTGPVRFQEGEQIAMNKVIALEVTVLMEKEDGSREKKSILDIGVADDEALTIRSQRHIHCRADSMEFWDHGCAMQIDYSHPPRRVDESKDIDPEPGFYVAPLYGSILYTDNKELAERLNQGPTYMELDMEFPGFIQAVDHVTKELNADMHKVFHYLHIKGRLQATAGPMYMCQSTNWVVI